MCERVSEYAQSIKIKGKQNDNVTNNIVIFTRISLNYSDVCIFYDTSWILQTHNECVISETRAEMECVSGIQNALGQNIHFSAMLSSVEVNSRVYKVVHKIWEVLYFVMHSCLV